MVKSEFQLRNTFKINVDLYFITPVKKRRKGLYKVSYWPTLWIFRESAPFDKSVQNMFTRFFCLF